MKINSIDKEIHAIFESSFYVIPRFQRPYSWDKDNIQEFWHDSIANDEDEYFIGSIVVFKKKDKTYGVVDGQQRLTTITLILSSLRNAYKKYGFNDQANGLHNLIERKNIDNETKYVLKTETSFPYLQEHIQKFDKPDIDIIINSEEKNIESAFKQINLLISKAIKSISDDTTLPEEEKEKKILKKINHIRTKILNLKIIFIELDNENDAYLIFETLNTRGKDLSPSDLVKNLLARHIKPKNKDVDKVSIIWAKIMEIVENAPGELSINNFLHHHWLSKYDYTSNKKLYKLIRQTINKNNADDYLKDLEFQSSIYRYINDPQFKSWTNEEQQIRNSLIALDIFNVRQPLPLILAIMYKYEKKEITKKQTSGVLRAIESFIFKYTAIVTTQSTGGLSMMYSSFAKRFSSSTTESEINIVLNDIKKRLRELSPQFNVFKLGFEDLIYTKLKNKHRLLIKYILTKFYNDLNKSHIIDFTKMSIEHLRPQDKIIQDKSDQYIGSLGNLILLSSEINLKLANKDFDKKIKILVNESYVLDEKIQNKEQWDIDEIEDRLDWMCKLAFYKFWKI